MIALYLLVWIVVVWFFSRLTCPSVMQKFSGKDLQVTLNLEKCIYSCTGFFSNTFLWFCENNYPVGVEMYRWSYLYA